MCEILKSLKGVCSLVIFLTVGMGCATPDAEGNKEAPAASSPPPKLQAAPRSMGHVVMVRPEMRYLVVDFQLSVPPASGTVLGVYREGRPVGAVRLSDQAEQNIFAADMLDGDLQVGDLVY